MVITRIFVAVTFKHLVSYSSLFFSISENEVSDLSQTQRPQMSTVIFAANQMTTYQEVFLKSGK